MPPITYRLPSWNTIPGRMRPLNTSEATTVKTPGPGDAGASVSP